MVIEISVTEARAEFSELINRVGYGGERVVITRHGKPLVALVAASEAASIWDGEQPGKVTVLDLGSRATSNTQPLGAAAHHPRPHRDIRG
jgi:prevent-host-death family protein